LLLAYCTLKGAFSPIGVPGVETILVEVVIPLVVCAPGILPLIEPDAA